MKLKAMRFCAITTNQIASFLSKNSFFTEYYSWKKYLQFGIKIRKIDLLFPEKLQNKLFPANSRGKWDKDFCFGRPE